MAAAGGEVLIAGAYVVTLNGNPMGIMEGDASLPTLEHTNKGEPIANTDKYGKTTIETIYQGGDWFMQMVAMEYKADPKLAWWPFGAVGVMGVVGRMFTGMAKQLLLTAVAGTPAVGSPTTLLARVAILAQGFSTRTAFGPTLRKLPLRFQLYPYDFGGGVIVWFEQT